MKYISIFENETTSLTKHPDKEDYWLYDYTRGMNLAMGANTEQEAFVEALTYYQKRLAQAEKELKSLTTKVEDFIESVSPEN